MGVFPSSSLTEMGSETKEGYGVGEDEERP
jgi:hypothetical protein